MFPMYHSLPSHLSPPLSIPLSLLCHLSCLSIAYSFIVVTLGAAVCMVCSCVSLLAGLGQYSFSIYVNIYVISLTFFSTILFFLKPYWKSALSWWHFPMRFEVWKYMSADSIWFWSSHWIWKGRVCSHCLIRQCQSWEWGVGKQVVMRWCFRAQEALGIRAYARAKMTFLSGCFSDLRCRTETFHPIF